MQRVFLLSIITLMPINCSFFFLHSRWYLEDLCGNVLFFSDGLTNLVQLVRLSCLCKSSLIFNLQDWKVEYVEIIVVPKEKALIAIASSFWMPRHISIQLLINSSSKEILSGFSNFSTILWKREGLSFYSVVSFVALDYLSASIFIVPGICAAATHY